MWRIVAALLLTTLLASSVKSDIQADNDIQEEHEVHANVSSSFMKNCLKEQKIEMNSQLIVKVDNYVHNYSSSEAPPERDIACYYKCEYEFSGMMKNGHLLGKPIFHMHKSNIDEHVVEYFSHMEKSVKKCATMTKAISDKCDMTGAFLTCVDKKMDGSVHVKHHKNSLMSPHYSNLANSLMSAFRDEVRVKLDNTIHEEHEIHANVSATFMKKCLAEQKIDMNADLLCKVDDYVHNISSSEAPPARDISCYYMCEYQFIGLMKNGHLVWKEIYAMHRNNTQDRIDVYFHKLQKSINKCIRMTKSISDKCDMTGGFLTCIDRKMGASYVKKHKNSLESGYDRAVNDMMAAFKNEYLNSLSI